MTSSPVSSTRGTRRLAELYVTGRMLLRINSGDYADLAIPLHHNAERVLDALDRCPPSR